MARKNRARRQLSSRAVRQNMITERQAGSSEVVVVSSRRRIRSSLVAACVAAVRRQRPDLPVQRIENGRLMPGLKVHVDDDTRTLWIECTSERHWTNKLNLDAFPTGVQVLRFGPNVVGVFAPVTA